MSETVPLSAEPGRFARIGVPLLAAVAVHLLAALALDQGWRGERAPRDPQRVEAVQARLITLEAQAPEPAPAPQAPPERQPPPERQADNPPQKAIPTEPEAARPEREPARENAPPAPAEPVEPEREAVDDPAPADAWREALGDRFDSALEQEAAELAASRAEQVTASYVGDIVARIEGNWSRPPSARNDMEAELLIALVPTGEVVNVTVVRSSGNAAFDRSAEVAVRQAAPFRVPDDPALFERDFRALRILFKPEDLRN